MAQRRRPAERAGAAVRVLRRCIFHFCVDDPTGAACARCMHAYGVRRLSAARVHMHAARCAMRQHSHVCMCCVLCKRLHGRAPRSRQQRRSAARGAPVHNNQIFTITQSALLSRRLRCTLDAFFTLPLQ